MKKSTIFGVLGGLAAVVGAIAAFFGGEAKANEEADLIRDEVSNEVSRQMEAYEDRFVVLEEPEPTEE